MMNSEVAVERSQGSKPLIASTRLVSTLFLNRPQKIQHPLKSKINERLRIYLAPKVLIINEMGYLPLDELGATIFFQLVSARYERGSILLTSNKSYGEWGSIFGDPIIATAILDRLLHHSTTLNIRGESYRLKERRKAGLIPVPEAQPEDSRASAPNGRGKRTV